MSLAQENFDRAISSGYNTLRNLSDAAKIGGTPIDLSKASTRKLEQIAWELEAIQAALRLEINRRMAGEAMDLG